MDGGYTMKDAPANFIGGEWQTEPETMAAVNPATGETIAQLPRSSRETAQRAVAAAKAAAPAWAEHAGFQARRDLRCHRLGNRRRSGKDRSHPLGRARQGSCGGHG